jgi:site-specific DNA-methyltransferase (adenine-specific)
MPPYEDVIRPFMVDSSKEFTDVWNFPSVRPYKGKHPAEKPVEMLEHAIETTTYPGDLVLDCFSGSGNTALAASRLGRLSVSIEIDPAWVSYIETKLRSANGRGQMKPGLASKAPSKKTKVSQPTLFVESR